MTTLSSKIKGIQLWTYDFSRRPDKSLDSQGLPQISAYAPLNSSSSTVRPVTQKPTEFTNQAINLFRYVCDPKHVANGNIIKTHGIKWTTGDNIDQQIKPKSYSSDARFTNVIFNDDDVYIQAGDQNPLDDSSKTPFTTKTAGITIVDQTGIVPPSYGVAVLIFEVNQGYKIPVAATISANPTVVSDYGSGEIPAAPETYQITTEMLPGIYEITLSSDPSNSWSHCDIDFATVQTTVTPIPAPVSKTIPISQKLTHATSNISGDTIDRKLNAINVTADIGYTFKTNIEISFYTGGKVVKKYNVDGDNKNAITIPLNTTKDNTITNDIDSIELNAIATPVSTVSTGYEHNYLITDTELSDFGKDYIYHLFFNGDQVVDKSNTRSFVDNLIELPFKVDVPTTINPISVGSNQSHVASHEAGSRFAELDLGTIKIPAKYHNGYDYQNKSVKLHAPFIPPITINNENAIEKDIHISYKIDISNGDTTVNLDNQGVLFYTGTTNIASQLPLVLTQQNTSINRGTHFNDNGIKQPYIVVTRETPVLNSDYYPTNERGLIKGYNGNVKVRLLNNMNIPQNELLELTSLLESGVKYVKGS